VISIIIVSVLLAFLFYMSFCLCFALLLVVATLALGSRPRQRGCKVTGQEGGSPGVKAKALQGYGLRAKREEARESR